MTYSLGLSEQDQLTSRNSWKRSKQELEGGRNEKDATNETLLWGQLDPGDKKIGPFVGPYMSRTN